MTTLFDKLRRKLEGDDEPLPTIAPQQDAIAAALRAKSGKATTSTSPTASNIGEQAATNVAATQMAQQQQAGKLAGLGMQQAVESQQAQQQQAKEGLAANVALQQQQLATQRQAGEQQLASQTNAALQSTQFSEAQKAIQLNSAADMAVKQLAADKELTLDNIWRDFRSSNQELSFRKDAARIEQTGFLLAMRDKSYLDELQRVGIERDLTDKLNYKDEMTRLMLGTELDNLLDDMDFKRSFNSTQREWDYKLASMDLDSAMAIANATLTAQSQAKMWEGANQIAKVGIDYATDYKPTKTISKTPAVTNDELTSKAISGGEANINLDVSTTS